jgi:hypothetical protein
MTILLLLHLANVDEEKRKKKKAMLVHYLEVSEPLRYYWRVIGK